jgi:hypothetical protein
LRNAKRILSFLFLLSCFFLIYSGAALAAIAPVESANYHIQKGTLHKGGSAQIVILEKTKKKFSAKMSYVINKKILVPIPKKVLEGETVINLPPEFKDKRGYAALEKKGFMEIENARLQFIKRMTWNGKEGAYDILIQPSNGKSQIEVIYHPSIPAAGWGKVVITFISPYPILNGYHAVIELN